MATQRQELPESIEVKRSDPVYMAHAYLTKVPVAAIVPFIQAFTQPGQVVLDPFAGSGMTGVAAAILGRRARLFDISVLGRHIGTNYLNLVDAHSFHKHAVAVIAAARQRVGGVYDVRCQHCHCTAELTKTVWSVVVRCRSCRGPVTFYHALEAAGWRKDRMTCPTCGTAISSRDARIGEEPVLDAITCTCSRTQLEQPHTPALSQPQMAGLQWPDLPIEPHRQMYQASALGRHGLTSTAKFFSTRNLAVLAALDTEIDRVDDPALQDKLRFAFTAILTRASKRYQWSRQRPLNAANATYYVATVFYEWNVFDLFTRKINALVSSDDWIRAQLGSGTLFDSAMAPDVTYKLANAASLPLPDGSVDYVFTDPPFGSNIFYADMSLFHEAWLGELTDSSVEAVVDRSNGANRTAERYEALLTNALRECARVLKPAGRISMVFGNSSGEVWSLVQRAVAAAGLMIDPDTLATLNKGQRSVKGLASGFENVATLDLVLTMQPSGSGQVLSVHRPAVTDVEAVIGSFLRQEAGPTPSHLYLELLRHGFRHGWDLSRLDLRHVIEVVASHDFSINAKSGRLTRVPTRKGPPGTAQDSTELVARSSPQTDDG
jgi:16S rRNA G966 N2-methylase RsmD